jgi:hypothetical protein
MVDMELKHKEGDLSRLLGLSRAELKDLRGRAMEGKHWARIANSARKQLWPVKWTDEGLEWIRKDMNLEVELVKEVEAAVEVREFIGVVSGKYRNTRIIACILESGRNRVPINVMVKDSKNFVVGMRVPLRKDFDRWVAAKHPRFGGKW